MIRARGTMTSRHEDLRVVRFDSLDEARATWLDFEPRADRYAVQGYHWLAHWQDKVGRRLGVKPCVVAVYRSDQLLMLLPLGLIRKAGSNCVIWLGGEITDYYAPLLNRDYPNLARPEEFADIWSRVVERLPAHDAIHLEKQPEKVGNQPNPFTLLPGQWVQDINMYCALDSEESCDAYVSIPRQGACARSALPRMHRCRVVRACPSRHDSRTPGQRLRRGCPTQADLLRSTAPARRSPR